MNKTEYYKLITEWEKKMKRLEYLTALLILAFFCLIGMAASFVPFFAKNPVYFGLTGGVMTVPLFIWVGKAKKLSIKIGLQCQHCQYNFSNYQSLMKIGFTNQCPKCGSVVYET
jgi:hypothetical protein